MTRNIASKTASLLLGGTMIIATAGMTLAQAPQQGAPSNVTPEQSRNTPQNDGRATPRQGATQGGGSAQPAQPAQAGSVQPGQQLNTEMPNSTPSAGGTNRGSGVGSGN